MRFRGNQQSLLGHYQAEAAIGKYLFRHSKIAVQQNGVRQFRREFLLGSREGKEEEQTKTAAANITSDGFHNHLLMILFSLISRLLFAVFAHIVRWVSRYCMRQA